MNDIHDFWTQQAETPARQQNLRFTLEVIPDVVPLGDQFDAEKSKTVPDALFLTLFGQPESQNTSARMRTFALLDAAKVPALPEMLEASGLKHCCLFKGVAYDELKDVAPWLVCLEEGNSFTRNLFTRSDAPWHLWDTEPGLYFRSRGTLDQLWGHLRKFTRIQNEAGKWFYFRFWDAGCLIDYIRYAEKQTGNDLRFLFGFDPKNSFLPLIHAYISVGGSNAEVCSVSRMAGHNVEPRTKVDMPIIRFLALRSHAHRFVDSYYEGKGATASAAESQNARKLAVHIVQKYHSFGFKSRYHLGSFVYWALALKADFEPRAQVICNQVRRDADPNERFVLIAREIKAVFGPKIRNYRGYGT